MALVMPSEVWAHGLLPLPAVSEERLLCALHDPPLPPDRPLTLSLWLSLAPSLGLTEEQAKASMRLAHILSLPPLGKWAMPTDVNLRVPLPTLLLHLWLHTGGVSSTLTPPKTQTARGDVWPSLLSPPAAGEGGLSPSLVMLARLSHHMEERHARVKASLPTLLRLACLSKEVKPHELDRLGLLLRPEDASAARLEARGLAKSSISAALGLWDEPNVRLTPHCCHRSGLS